MLITILNDVDSFLIFPYTRNNWAVIIIFLVCYVIRMILMRKSKKEDNPNFEDWILSFLIASFFTFCVFEIAITIQFKAVYMFPLSGFIVVVSPYFVEYLALTDEGRKFASRTFLKFLKQSLTAFLGTIGLQIKPKKDEE